MQCSFNRAVVLFAAMILAAETACAQVEAFAWGKPSKGVRVGLALVDQPSNAKIIKIMLQNVSPAAEDLVLGARCGHSVSYLLDYTLIGPDHRPHALMDNDDGPCSGIALPIQVHLASGAFYSIERPVNLLLVSDGPGSNPPLSQFLQCGYVLGVSFDEKGKYFDDLQMGIVKRPPHAWTGRCVSGELPLGRKGF